MADSSSRRIAAAAERLRRAEADVADRRHELRVLMRDEIAAGRQTKSSIARILGLSRQRVGRMLDEVD